MLGQNVVNGVVAILEKYPTIHCRSQNSCGRRENGWILTLLSIRKPGCKLDVLHSEIT